MMMPAGKAGPFAGSTAAHLQDQPSFVQLRPMPPGRRKLLPLSCFSCTRPSVKGEEEQEQRGGGRAVGAAAVNGNVTHVSRPVPTTTPTIDTVPATTTTSSSSVTTSTSRASAPAHPPQHPAALQDHRAGSGRKETPWELVSPLGVSAAFTPDVLAPLPDAAELTDDAWRRGRGVSLHGGSTVSRTSTWASARSSFCSPLAHDAMLAQAQHHELAHAIQQALSTAQARPQHTLPSPGGSGSTTGAAPGGTNVPAAALVQQLSENPALVQQLSEGAARSGISMAAGFMDRHPSGSQTGVDRHPSGPQVSYAPLHRDAAHAHAPAGPSTTPRHTFTAPPTAAGPSAAAAGEGQESGSATGAGRRATVAAPWPIPPPAPRQLRHPAAGLTTELSYPPSNLNSNYGSGRLSSGTRTSSLDASTTTSSTRQTQQQYSMLSSAGATGGTGTTSSRTTISSNAGSRRLTGTSTTATPLPGTTTGTTLPCATPSTAAGAVAAAPEDLTTRKGSVGASFGPPSTQSSDASQRSLASQKSTASFAAWTPGKVPPRLSHLALHPPQRPPVVSPIVSPKQPQPPANITSLVCASNAVPQAAAASTPSSGRQSSEVQPPPSTQLPVQRRPTALTKYDGQTSFRPQLSAPPKQYPPAVLLVSVAHGTAAGAPLPDTGGVSPRSPGGTGGAVASKLSPTSSGGDPGVVAGGVTGPAHGALTRVPSRRTGTGPRKSLGPLGVLPYWVPPEPLPFVDPNTTWAPWPAHTVGTAYWGKIDELSSPNPIPIDRLINAHFIARKAHESIKGLKIKESATALEIVVKATVYGAPYIHREVYHKNGALWVGALRRDAKPGRSEYRGYFSPDYGGQIICSLKMYTLLGYHEISMVEVINISDFRSWEAKVATATNNIATTANGSGDGTQDKQHSTPSSNGDGTTTNVAVNGSSSSTANGAATQANSTGGSTGVSSGWWGSTKKGADTHASGTANGTASTTESTGASSGWWGSTKKGADKAGGNKTRPGTPALKDGTMDLEQPVLVIMQACVVHATGQFIDQTFAGRRVPLEDAGL